MGRKEGGEDYDVSLVVSLQNKRESQQALFFLCARHGAITWRFKSSYWPDKGNS